VVGRVATPHVELGVDSVSAGGQPLVEVLLAETEHHLSVHVPLVEVEHRHRNGKLLESPQKPRAHVTLFPLLGIGGNAKHTARRLDVLLDLLDSEVEHRLNLHLGLLLRVLLLLLHRSLLHCGLASLADEPSCDAKVKRLQVPFCFETVVLETLFQELVRCL